MAGNLLIVAACAFAALTTPLAAQSSYSPDSPLADSLYRESRIRNITDRDLFSSLDLSTPALADVRREATAAHYDRAYAAWGKYVSARAEPRYITQNVHLLLDTDRFISLDDARAYYAANPAGKESVMTRADLMLSNIIRTWGDNAVSFGPAVDFNRDVGQSGKYGFHYWLWSRPLLTAYVLTGDQRYLDKFADLFSQWYVQRNAITRGFPEFDVVYYELGLGIRNRVFIEYTFLPHTHRTPVIEEHLLKTLLAAGRWLAALEKWEGYRPGNWQIHGAFMLVQIALTFPEFKEANEWMRIGMQRLSEHLALDFYPDGGHSERCPRNYTLATYMAYRNLHYLLLTHHDTTKFVENIGQAMGRTIDWWLAMIAPTGEIPAINDSQRGLFPATILEDGAALFARAEVHGVLSLLSGDGPDDSVPAWTSRHMPASGFTVMRSDWSRSALYLSLNYGAFSGSHTHNDMLDFELYAYGKALAVDAGIGMTYDDPLYVPWYKSSRAHNMVVVNDLDMHRPGIVAEGIRWSATPSLEYFSGLHRGYDSLGVTATRTILFVKPLYWFVLDRLACRTDNDTLSWYLHSPETLEPFDAGVATTSAPGLAILPADRTFTLRAGTGMAASTRDLHPGKTEEINWIRFDQQTGKNQTREFAVLLFPFSSVRPDVRVTKRGAGWFEIRVGDAKDLVIFGEGDHSAGHYDTDATCVVVRTSDDRVTHMSIVNGTYVRIRGKIVWTAPQADSGEMTF